MATFKGDVEKVRLGNGAVVRFVDGYYTAVDASETKYLRKHPLLEEVEDESASESSSTSDSGDSSSSTDYQELVAKAKEFDIETQGKSKEDLATEVEAAEIKAAASS